MNNIKLKLSKTLNKPIPFKGVWIYKCETKDCHNEVNEFNSICGICEAKIRNKKLKKIK